MCPLDAILTFLFCPPTRHYGSPQPYGRWVVLLKTLIPDWPPDEILRWVGAGGVVDHGSVWPSRRPANFQGFSPVLGVFWVGGLTQMWCLEHSFNKVTWGWVVFSRHKPTHPSTRDPWGSCVTPQWSMVLPHLALLLCNYTTSALSTSGIG